MTTKLALVQRLAREAGASGVITTTVGQSGETRRLVDWVDTAHEEIESIHQDWQWLRKSMSFPTVADQATYTHADLAITDFGMWARDTFRNYVTTTGPRSEIFMAYIDYEAWRNNYQYGALRYSTSRPIEFSITPDKSIALGPVPVDGYTVIGDYYRAPRVLLNDADTPDMPEQFQMAIVWRALMFYGGYENAPEAVTRGQVEFSRMTTRMATDRLPQVGFGGSLA